MKILLYKPNSKTAFRKFDNPCEVIITEDSSEVQIIDMTKTETRVVSDMITNRYRLIKKYQPIWTSKKACEEVMVKLIVEELD